MFGKNSIICIAGKNTCAIECLNFIIKKYYKSKICSLPNKSDNGVDGWQKSFRKFSNKKKIKIISLEKLYNIKKLIFFSIEYEKIINVRKFKSNQLFNLHFSLLPKYRGCHTNFYQIYNGEKKSGVTLHKINHGIDEGDIIDNLSFKIGANTTAYDNYLKLMNYSVKLFKKNINKIINNNYITKKQKLYLGTYYSRKSVNYTKISKINSIKNNIKTHNKIRSLIFPPFQLPIYKGNKIKKSIFKKNKIYLNYEI